MTCPGSHCQGLVLLGPLDAQEPHRVGVTVPDVPSSKQQALNKYLWNA